MPSSKLKDLFTINRVMFVLAIILGTPGYYVFFHTPILDPWSLFGLSVVFSVIPIIIASVCYVTLVFVKPEDPNFANVAGLLLLIVGLFLGTYGFIGIINVGMDNASPEVHRVQVMDKYERTPTLASFLTGEPTPRESTHREKYISVRSWREGRSREEFAVSSKVYSNLYVDRREEIVKIKVKPGLLGLPWVSNVIRITGSIQ